MRALLFVVLLAGCVTSTPIYTQDGRQGHAIECGGTVRTWGQCLQKAGELCGPRAFRASLSLEPIVSIASI